MKKTRVILGSLCFLNILAWIGVFQLSHANLEVNFFNVGQGDSIFIKTPQNQQILIDGGPTSIILEKLGKEMPFWDRTLDLIVLTHPDFDHVSGLIEVLKRYKVQNILWTGISCETAECQEWTRLIKEEIANIYIAKAGQRIEGGGVSINILYPLESLEGKTVKSTNNTSIVTRLIYGENSFLFTGDAYESVERELVQNGSDIASDVLKVAHHGSKNSSAEAFIQTVSPEVAVISLGKDNKYGHPHKETLDILDEYGISILRTDLGGDIKILADKNNFNLKP